MTRIGTFRGSEATTLAEAGRAYALPSGTQTSQFGKCHLHLSATLTKHLLSSRGADRNHGRILDFPLD